MDRDSWDANTDNLAVVDPGHRTVTSVPRDLWCEVVGDRINQAWRLGGPDLLVRSLAEHGFVVDAVVCLRREAVARALADVTVEVPVERPMVFLYPRHPEADLQDGAVIARFDPPQEQLSGVRIHQWLGARYGLRGPGPDIERIPRQHTLTQQLLRADFDFTCLLADPARVRVTDELAMHSLAMVRPEWAFATFDRVVPRTIGGAHVLVRSTRAGRRRYLVLRAAKRAVSSAWRRSGLHIPTWGIGPTRRRTRLLAVVAVRNEERYLPGLLDSIAPHVEGVIALDDGSTDRSAAVLRAHSIVLEVLPQRPDREGWDEVDNHRRLVHAAIAHDADWIIALDADERVERRFRARVERAIRRGGLVGLNAFAVSMRELWGDADTWRTDGIWGRKAPARLFAARADHEFDVRPLHASKAPNQGKRLGTFIKADVRIYHLRMIELADRVARRERYETLDPDGLWQDEGYAYLTDESRIRLKRVRASRRPAHT